VLTILKLNAAQMTTIEVIDRRIDRLDELEECTEALVSRQHNVLLYGSRGVGKTFLVKLIEARIRESGCPLFPCIANVANVSLYGNSSASVASSDDTSGFLRAILLQLCRSLWNLIGNKYLDLREQISDPPHLSDGPEASSIRRVFNLLMRLECSVSKSSTGSIGVGAVIKGELKGESISESHTMAILPFEFAEFVEELTVEVLQPRGYNRVVFLCDEANHMPLFCQEQLLDQCLDLFRGKGAQFLFVGGYLPIDGDPLLPACFETMIELKGFHEKKHVRELLSQCRINDCEFSDEAIDIIYEAYAGHPRSSLLVADRAMRVDTGKMVSANSVERAREEVDQQLKIEQFRIKTANSSHPRVTGQ